MSNILAHIQIHPGKEAQFEDVMAYMYRETHDNEQGVLRYEYWRGRETGHYYCLLSFDDNLTFWRHQASDHHEGQMARFAECIQELDLETIDPVATASPLPATSDQTVPDDEPEIVKTQAAQFPIDLASWWLALRQN